jgi:homogentisate 1,2-dioxygenase
LYLGPLAFFHNIHDYDEIIFYHRGQFISRDEIRPGMLTVHPAGITHLHLSLYIPLRVRRIP